MKCVVRPSVGIFTICVHFNSKINLILWHTKLTCCALISCFLVFCLLLFLFFSFVFTVPVLFATLNSPVFVVSCVHFFFFLYLCFLNSTNNTNNNNNNKICKKCYVFSFYACVCFSFICYTQMFDLSTTMLSALNERLLFFFFLFISRTCPRVTFS